MQMAEASAMRRRDLLFMGVAASVLPHPNGDAPASGVELDALVGDADHTGPERVDVGHDNLVEFAAPQVLEDRQAHVAAGACALGVIGRAPGAEVLLRLDWVRSSRGFWFPHELSCPGFDRRGHQVELDLFYAGR